MTTLHDAPAPGAQAAGQVARARRTGRWIDDWTPEDPQFWEAGGKRVARRNLVWSIFAEHLGFSVWLIWSVSAAMLGGTFGYSPQQLFFLVAAPNLVGALIRVPYTFAVPRFGGRNWTIASALLLLVPTVLYVVAVQDTSTPYWVMVVIAATAGLGGGNFASSMANINAFYPADKKGVALGLNAAGGNVGVAVIQFPLPVIVGGAAGSASGCGGRVVGGASRDGSMVPRGRDLGRYPPRSGARTLETEAAVRLGSGANRSSPRSSARSPRVALRSALVRGCRTGPTRHRR